MKAKIRREGNYNVFHCNGKRDEYWLPARSEVEILYKVNDVYFCRTMAYGYNIVMILPKEKLVFEKKVLKIESSDPNMVLAEAINKSTQDDIGRVMCSSRGCTKTGVVGPLRFSIETEEE